ATGANLVYNGSFEITGPDAIAQAWGTSASTMPGWTRLNSGQASTVLGFEQVVSGHQGIVATDGAYSFDLDGASGGASNMHIAQDIAGLTDGELLLIDFDHSNRTTAASGSFEVLWNGAVIAS